MTTTADSYREANGPLSTVIASASESDWEQPSPCDGWTARDVLGHLVGTQRDFFASRDIDLGPPPDLGADPATGWRAHAGSVTSVVADEAVAGQSYDGHFGPTTVGETLVSFYIFDMVVHRWDLARSFGVDERLTEDELDRIETGITTFGDALYMEGVCRPGVEATPDADRQARLLATLGRVDARSTAEVTGRSQTIPRHT